MLWWVWGALAGVVINCLVGALVLSLVDHEDERLFKWVHSSPMPHFIPFIALMLWPIVAWKFRHDNPKDSE